MILVFVVFTPGRSYETSLYFVRSKRGEEITMRKQQVGGVALSLSLIFTFKYIFFLCYTGR